MLMYLSVARRRMFGNQRDKLYQATVLRMARRWKQRSSVGAR